MPTYEYKCVVCGRVKDHQLPVQHVVPRHHRKPMSRVWSSVSVAFKGQGFTKATHQVELSDGKRGTVSEDGFERIKKIDPDARLIKV